MALWRSSAGHAYQFNFTRDLGNSLWMATVLDEGIFQGLSTVDKQAAKDAALFAGNPVTTSVPPNKDGTRVESREVNQKDGAIVSRLETAA